MISENNSFLSIFLGTLKLKWRAGKLAALILPPVPPALRTSLKQDKGKAGEKPAWKNILGMRNELLDFSTHNAFQCAVWRQTQKIPFGQVRSYGWIAREIGKPGAARAVGQALKANLWPLLVPCHRVIRADGSLGGFGSGREWKKFLLDFEKNLISQKKEIWQDD